MRTSTGRWQSSVNAALIFKRTDNLQLDPGPHLALNRLSDYEYFVGSRCDANRPARVSLRLLWCQPPFWGAAEKGIRFNAGAVPATVRFTSGWAPYATVFRLITSC